MDKKSFYKNKEYICFRKKDMEFKIDTNEYKDEIILGITCEKQGFVPTFWAHILKIYLSKNFYNLPITRLRYLVSEKKKVRVYNDIPKKEYQHYPLEILFLLFFTLSVFFLGVKSTFLSTICFFLAAIFVALALIHTIYKILDFVTGQKEYVAIIARELMIKICLNFTLFLSILVFWRIYKVV